LISVTAIAAFDRISHASVNVCWLRFDARGLTTERAQAPLVGIDFKRRGGSEPHFTTVRLKPEPMARVAAAPSSSLPPLEPPSTFLIIDKLATVGANDKFVAAPADAALYISFAGLVAPGCQAKVRANVARPAKAIGPIDRCAERQGGQRPSTAAGMLARHVLRRGHAW
jgi:hypothetical protein